MQNQEFKDSKGYRTNANTLAYMQDYRAPSHVKQANIHRLSGHIARIMNKIRKIQPNIDKLISARKIILTTPQHDKNARLVQNLLDINLALSKLEQQKKTLSDLVSKSQAKLNVIKKNEYVITDKKHIHTNILQQTGKDVHGKAKRQSVDLNIGEFDKPVKTNWLELSSVKARAIALVQKDNQARYVYKYKDRDNYNIETIERFNNLPHKFITNCVVLYTFEP